jgi:hypothetical protein
LRTRHELREWLAQRLGTRRPHHRLADTDQQRIAEQIAQSRQRVTRRWLREADALAGTPHMRLVQQGFEQHQQVHIHGS